MPPDPEQLSTQWSHIAGKFCSVIVEIVILKKELVQDNACFCSGLYGKKLVIYYYHQCCCNPPC